MDNEIAKTFQKTLEGQGLSFMLGHKVTEAKSTAKSVTLNVEPAAGGEPITLDADVVLVAIGRRPFTEGLGLDEVGVERDKQGRVVVDGSFRTSAPGVFAIGDVIDGPMLAHKAEKEGVAVAEIIAGRTVKVDYNTVPGIVYTAPEVANIGFTEQELKDAGVAYKAGKFPFKANSRARAMEETDGLVKLLAHKDNGRILGAHIIGKDAGTLIHEVAAVMEFGGSYDDLTHIIHGHPTLNEAVKEAAMAIDKRAIHV
jgi:dihydrolipoamide dehydrogenase